MKDDNTPIVSARRRKPTPHMRLRLETAKKLQKLGALAKKKRAESKEQKVGETDLGVPAAPRPSKAKKNALAKPVKPVSRFRKRQIHKSWLPTHLYHAKRAHMTPPKEPLWRFAIPFTPTDKCYRATHRAGSDRGCVAWDTSYMSTIGVEGVEVSLLGLLKGLGVEENMLAGKREAKWIRGLRGWEGWIRDRGGEKNWIAKVSVVWCVQDTKEVESVQNVSGKKPKRRLFIRVHPSAFLQVWNETLKVSKIQRPMVMVEDLRFEIGSIEITGPGSTETLISALQPVAAPGNNPPNADAPEGIWPNLVAITNPACLPANALLGFDITDPRLHYPPRTLKHRSSSNAEELLLHMLSAWPPDTTQPPPNIFSPPARFEASRLLPSQKSINRRKGAALPGAYPDPLSRDPQIPVLLQASRSSSTSANQGSWTVLLPWKCVLPVWYSIMHYPISSGGNPRFGGLREKRQIAFEQSVPWFPGDFPGTKAGWDWECMEREKRKVEWEKRPKGKRVAWESVDLGDGRKGEEGRGWACDWERLFEGPPLPTPDDAGKTEPPAAKLPATSSASNPPLASLSTPPPVKITHIPSPATSNLLTSSPSNTISPTALTTISLTLLTRGTPTPCTRIYRLPTTNPALRARWLGLISSKSKNKNDNNTKNNNRKQSLSNPPENAPDHVRASYLASSLLTPTNHTEGPMRAGDEQYPTVPDEADLIGFVTTGNFNLGKGRSTAIGNIGLARIVTRNPRASGGGSGVEGGGGGQGKQGVSRGDGKQGQNGEQKDDWEKGGKKVGLSLATEDKFCILREAGQGLGRLARWDFI